MKRFWIIDTDSPGENQGSYSASGPFPSMKAAKDYMRQDAKDCFENSCGCMRHDRSLPWSKAQIIVEERARILPTPSSTTHIKLKTVKP